MAVTFLGTAAGEFSAAHRIEFHPTCGRNHGHRWRVEVTIAAGQDPKTGELLGLPELAGAVRELCAELDREDLAVMLAISHPTGAGIALAFRERLAMAFPTIVHVIVWMDRDLSVTLSG